MSTGVITTSLSRQDVTVVLRQWESKGYSMWDKACRLVPVHLRTSGVTSPTPVRAVCHYETSEVSVVT